MWIDFETTGEKRKFAIRPFLGGVNGITGEPMIGNMASLRRRMNSVNSLQDYVVLPDQPWLDGIATSPGVVKQFVATKLALPRQETLSKPRAAEDLEESRPSSDNDSRQHHQKGATIEWQVTGEDAVG